MVSLCAYGYQQPVVKGEAKPSGAQRSLPLTTPSLTPSLAVETRSLLSPIAEMGCRDMLVVVCQENASQLASRRGSFEVVDG